MNREEVYAQINDVGLGTLCDWLLSDNDTFINTVYNLLKT